MTFLLLIVAGAVPTALHATSVAELPHTRVEFISETKTPAPGESFTVGLIMTPRSGWHTYWENPGDAGMPTRAQWNLPQGLTAGPLRYPTPDTFMVAGIMNHVFKGAATLLTDITVPAGANGALPVSLKLDWLVCDDKSCVPESATLSLPLTIGDGAPDASQRQQFADARAALPRQLAEPGQFTLSDNRIRIAIPMAATSDITSAHFFASGDDATVFAAPQTIGRTNSAIIVETDAAPNATPEAVAGVLRVEGKDGPLGLALTAHVGEVPAGMPLAAASPTSRSNAAGAAFLPALALALLGGLLLNLMPCVFPILSLKAMSLARAGESQQQARSEGIAYTVGVVLVCLLLGGIVIALAQFGKGAGWAFQLQNPGIILFLMLLTLVIGLNFAGLFEMNFGNVSAGQTLASKPGAKGAFWTGALAAFVATPCTGPFMAGALGAALVLPPLAGLAIFAGLGLGLALPFLAIGFIPALRRRLPKPGAWMLTFRRILAIPMLLTALALAWVLGRQTGASGLTLGLLFALLVGLGLWWLGLRQQSQRRTLIPALLAIGAALIAPAALARLPAQDAAAATGQALSGMRFSPEKLAALQAERQPLFLYFTADWCLTCKVNEHGPLASSAVAAAFDNANIQVMVGDWTRPDADIAHFLEQQGRAGIPLYLFYDGNGNVSELPQLLTVDRLLAVAGDA